MSEPKFTPGPWHVLYDDILDEYRCTIHNEKSFLIANVSLAVIRRGETYKEKQLANAHLIAVAPDLYAVLDELIRKVGHNEDNLTALQILMRLSDLINRAEDLLAKARGEVQ